MSLRTAAAARQERNSGARIARERPFPLPLKGIYSDARTGEFQGVLADTLDNWKSNGVSLEMRSGYTTIASETIQQHIPYEFGQTPAYIKVTPTALTFSGFTLARTNTADFSWTSISSNVIMADGNGDILRCDGTDIQDAAFTTTTGKDPDEFNGVFSHHDRIYAWDSSALEFYYGAVGAVTGELTRFPLDRLGNITGNIKIITNMTINAAHGMNDVLVIVTTSGHIVLYEGLDPGDANDWRLLGRVPTAPPVSQFAVTNFGSDLWVLTGRGVVSVRESLMQGALAFASQITKPISDSLIADIASNGSDLGWQMYPRPDDGDVLVNVPTDTGFKQYAYTVESGSWAMRDYQSRWWHSLIGVTDFTGSNGNLERLNRTGDDNGAAITATIITSWIRMRTGTEVATLIPTIIADGALEVTVAVLTDHNELAADIVQAEQTFTLSPENAGDRVTLNEEFGVNAIGSVFQLRWTITGINLRFESLLATIL